MQSNLSQHRQGIRNFLLVVNDNVDRISHGFSATATDYCQNVVYETYFCMI